MSLKDIKCKHCGARGTLRVVSTMGDPIKKFPGETHLEKCGYRRPFIKRIRECTNCGAVYQTVEVIVSWGTVHTPNIQEGEDNDS